MTQDDFVALASRVSFSGGLIFWAPTVTAEPWDGGVWVKTTKIVLDRALTRMPTHPSEVREGMGGTIGGDYYLTSVQLARLTPWSAREKLLFFVRDSMIHEVDEGIRFDGVPVRDPHADEPAPFPEKQNRGSP